MNGGANALSDQISCDTGNAVYRAFFTFRFFSCNISCRSYNRGSEKEKNEVVHLMGAAALISAAYLVATLEFYLIVANTMIGG